MITSNLYENVLINPLKLGGKDLYIVSGYASATFANKHLKESNTSKINLNYEERSDHLGFLRLYSNYDRFRGIT